MSDISKGRHERRRKDCLFDIGSYGRKTGITINRELERDALGMMDVQAFLQAIAEDNPQLVASTGSCGLQRSTNDDAKVYDAMQQHTVADTLPCVTGNGKAASCSVKQEADMVSVGLLGVQEPDVADHQSTTPECASQQATAYASMDTNLVYTVDAAQSVAMRNGAYYCQPMATCGARMASGLVCIPPGGGKPACSTGDNVLVSAYRDGRSKQG
ncbi:hypothetical protein THASP1DRAFT_22111 [Thamnocephalis sphaerospora]|uniref:Mif2 N-terminal domain-containing protein n=1 Tax=Thamnocephalis sphaerospora TaxID=78915 RepID=A0A4P9XV60_9FUNG|nr:hypothetical protein THASP1DRAFT_22111 [Thamnocephalis sphaerospora]|eukprot:RKP10138.1 hypothetical protein THASP1DRAFT_22111 [Thamnocephalis sphaerospora]